MTDRAHVNRMMETWFDQAVKSKRSSDLKWVLATFPLCACHCRCFLNYSLVACSILRRRRMRRAHMWATTLLDYGFSWLEAVAHVRLVSNRALITLITSVFFDTSVDKCVNLIQLIKWACQVSTERWSYLSFVFPCPRDCQLSSMTSLERFCDGFV